MAMIALLFSQLIRGLTIIVILFSVSFFAHSQRVHFLHILSTPREGDLAFIHCSWIPGDGNSTLSFLKDGRILTRNEAIVDAQFGKRSYVHLGFEHYDATLRFNAMRDDSGLYECCIYDGDPLENPPQDCESRFVEVFYLSNIYPICTPSDDVRISLSDQVTLTCLSEIGNPSATLKWTTANEINSTAMSSEIVSSRNGFITSNLTVLSTPVDINDIYTCTASNSRFTRKCSISVKTIWPSVFLYPHEAVVDLNDIVKFTCNFIYSINYVTTWEWNSNPSLDSSRISVVDNEFIINDVSMMDNGTSISCFALFENRWFQATSMLYVRKQTLVTQNSTVAPNTGSTKQRGEGSSGWKAAFAIFFVMFVAAIGGTILLLFLRFRNVSKPVLGVIHNPAIPTSSANQPATTEDTYTALRKPTEADKLEDVKQLVDTGNKSKNDYVYEIEDAEDNQTRANGHSNDSIYDYAATEDNHQHVYTNQNIGPRKT